MSVRRSAPVPSVWKGFLHEFRNHLTVLMAATSELRAEAPPAFALRVGETIVQMERHVQGLTELVAFVDASMHAGDPIIARLGDVVDRAVGLAGPVSGRSVSITTRVPRDTGVRNRGSLLECLLAALVADLARSGPGKPEGRPDGKAEGTSEPVGVPVVVVEADVDRRGLAIEVARPGARVDASSWRFALAAELAARLDVTLTSAPGASAYVVQFH